MADTTKTPVGESTLLSPLAQQRLRARIADAPGGIAAVAHEIRAQLAELDGMDMSRDTAAQRARLSDRAFYVAQLEYLDALARAASMPAQTEKPSLLARLRSMFEQTQPAK
jgi:hypothetical protein